jgi:DNA-directed RNA polymerase specialized sigma24 family protein
MKPVKRLAYAFARDRREEDDCLDEARPANLEVENRIDMNDLFPRTQYTWIGQRLQQGPDGRTDINHHVMSVYTWPLEIYFRSLRAHWLGDAEDIVQGFFASRLDREDFFRDWLESGMKLRRWLLNAFCFYLKEVRRERRRSDREEPLLDEGEGREEAPADEMDRAFAVSIVREALLETRRSCEARKLGAHWRIFEAHYYDGKSYAEICDSGEFGRIDTVRAATMARTAAGRFRTVLRGLLRKDGATTSHVDREIAALLEVTGD